MSDGKPTKPEHWKQGTPKEQAVAIVAGITGWLSNLEDGTSTPQRVAAAIRPRLGDFLALSQWLKDEWDEPTQDPRGSVPDTSGAIES